MWDILDEYEVLSIHNHWHYVIIKMRPKKAPEPRTITWILEDIIGKCQL